MKTISLTKLAEITLKKRLDRCMSQAEVQEQTGINRLMVGRIERGEFLPSLVQLNKLAEVLEFSVLDLLEDANEDNVYIAMRGEAKTEDELAGIEHLFSMMSFIKAQSVLRSRLTDECVL